MESSLSPKNRRKICFFSSSRRYSEVVQVHFDSNTCPYTTLVDVFCGKYDLTTLNRQGNDVGTQYRSVIYYCNEKQAKLARESLEAKQKEVKRNIVSDILLAKRFYKAEEYHQQYLEKGGRNGL